VINMASLSRRTPDDLQALIRETLAATSPGRGPLAADTPLVGPHAVVDSVGLVTLLVALEEELGGTVDLAASFLEQGDAEHDNPFRTIGSLAEHLHRLMPGSDHKHYLL
jgi:acyl carrier protein